MSSVAQVELGDDVSAGMSVASGSSGGGAVTTTVRSIPCPVPAPHRQATLERTQQLPSVRAPAPPTVSPSQFTCWSPRAAFENQAGRRSRRLDSALHSRAELGWGWSPVVRATIPACSGTAAIQPTAGGHPMRPQFRRELLPVIRWPHDGRLAPELRTCSSLSAVRLALRHHHVKIL
jgi:hypothetical protein